MNTYFKHLYYNKNFLNSKHFNILKYYHSEFLNNFKNGLPKYFDAVNRKNAKTKFKWKKEGLIKKYIFYNTTVIKFIIIDIDHRKEFNDKLELLEYLKDFNLTSSWVLDTKRGYQVGYILKKAIPHDNEKALNFAKDVQEKLRKLLGGDPEANKLTGRFRNPLVHDTFYTLNTFDLIDIVDNIPEFIYTGISIEHNSNKKLHNNITELKNLVLKVLNNINYIKNVEVGFRNSFMWYLGMMIAKNFQHLPDKRKYFPLIEEKIHFYNNNLKEPLEKKEVNNIVNSVYKYFMKGKIMVGLGAYEKWTPEMKNMYIKKYLKEKGIVKYSNEERKEINKNKVLQSIYKLRSENKKLSVRKIAEVCGLSKSTVAKYVKELKNDPKFAVLFN